MIRWINKQKYILFLTVLFVVSLLLNEVIPHHFLTFTIMTLLTLCAGFHIFKKAIMDIRYKIIGIDLLVTIAVVAAFIIGDYFEAAAVTYLFTLGHVLEKGSLEKTRSALKSLMNLKPKVARRIENKIENMISLSEVNVSDILLVKQGEMIPTDGIIMDGQGQLDEQIMTGESMPVDKTKDDSLFGATLLLSGYLFMKVTHVGEDTSLSKIIHMVEEAQDQKAKTQKFMEVFASYYTPLIVLLSIVLLIVTKDMRLAITMLVIACPGALVIATPVSYVSGIGNAAKKGILFKGGDSIERLAKGKVMFFDKTGTLTKGKPEVKVIKTYDHDENDLLRIAATAEMYSEHPLGQAIVDEAKRRGIHLQDEHLNTTFVIGKGLTFEYNEATYKIGNHKLYDHIMDERVNKDIDYLESSGYTTLIMSQDERILGLIGLMDGLRDHAKDVMNKLDRLGIKERIMLTGDQAKVAHLISKELEMTKTYASLLPEDKAKIIKSYQGKELSIFVGDGINDAVALSYADASIAMGGLGKDLAMETADVVLLGEDITKLSDAIKISRKVRSNMIQNIVFALVVVAILMVGVVFEKVSMSLGMFVHEVSVLAVLMNAIRLLRYDLGGLKNETFKSQSVHQVSPHL